MQKIDQSIKKSIKEVQSAIELQKEQFNKAIDSSTKTLAEQIETQQNLFPAINTRLTALEGINTQCDLPNALTSLTEQNLSQQLQECINKLNNIEETENQLMKQIEESNTAVKKEFSELDKKREDFEEQIKNEVSQKSSIISVKEEIASIIERCENIEKQE